MTHTKLIEKFRNSLKKYLTNYFFYVFPNPHGASLRPFDAILIYDSAIFAIEFKVGKDKLKKHQKYYLKKAQQAGALVLIINEKTDLNSLIKDYLKGEEFICCFDE